MLPATSPFGTKRRLGNVRFCARAAHTANATKKGATSIRWPLSFYSSEFLAEMYRPDRIWQPNIELKVSRGYDRVAGQKRTEACFQRSVWRQTFNEDFDVSVRVLSINCNLDDRPPRTWAMSWRFSHFARSNRWRTRWATPEVAGTGASYPDLPPRMVTRYPACHPS